MVTSHAVRAILLGLAVCRMCAAEDSKSVDGFRSELWRMEYREQEDRSEQKEASEESSESGPKQRPTADGEHLVERSQAGETHVVPSPGLLNLAQLQGQTPIAEWQVDFEANGQVRQNQFRRPPSAWQLSQVGSTHAAGIKSAEGPSMTTFFVAIVACVVVTGAMFSGRE